MKLVRFVRISLAFMIALCCGASARAGGTLWYTGDVDYYDAQANGVGAAPTPDALLYDNFVVNAGYTWTIDSVFSNNFMDYIGVTDAYWEIRTGVSAGNAGTLVAGGFDSAASQVDLGTNLLGLELYTITVSGLSVVLNPGQYWLTVAPVSPPTGGFPGNYSYIGTTSGANAVAPGNDTASFETSSGYGWYFTPTSDPSIEGTGAWAYSMGVTGQSVPEPASVILLGIGGTLCAGCTYLRRALARKSIV